MFSSHRKSGRFLTDLFRLVNSRTADSEKRLLHQTRRLSVESLESRQLLSATTWTVNVAEDIIETSGNYTTTDDDVSLREAIDCANAGDRIVFDQSVFTANNKTITLTKELEISKGIEIDGNLTNLTPEGSTEQSCITLKAGTEEGNYFRVVNVTHTGGTVSLNNLELTGGWLKDEGDDGAGLLFEQTSELKLDNVTITDNKTENGSGGGLANIKTDVGIDNNVTITNSRITNNQAKSGGGLFFDNVTVDISDTVIDNNRSTTMGGGISLECTQTGFKSGVFNLSNVVITNNQATNGGALYSAIPNFTSMQITQCVISGNSDSGNTLFLSYCGAPSGVESCISDSTIAGNITGSTVISSSGPPLILKNTIVARNITSNGELAVDVDTSNTYISGTHSLIGNSGTANTVGNNWNNSVDYINNQIGYANSVINPLFRTDPLIVSNGKYDLAEENDLHLLGNSLAVNSGWSFNSRTKDLDGSNAPVGGLDIKAHDIGAYEHQGTVPEISYTSIVTVKADEETGVFPTGQNLAEITFTDIDNLDSIVSWSVASLPEDNTGFNLYKDPESGKYYVRNTSEITFAEDEFTKTISFIVSGTDTYGLTGEETCTITLKRTNSAIVSMEFSTVLRESKLSDQQTSTDGNQVANSLPASSTISEWSKFYTEIWAEITGDITGEDSTSVSMSFTLNYDETLFTPKSFTASNLFSNFTVNNITTNPNDSLTVTATGTLTAEHIDKNIFIGKVLFDPATSKGAIGYKDYHKNFGLGIADDAQFTGAEYTVSDTFDHTVYAACYDLNDSGSVDMTDFIEFAKSFNASSTSASWDSTSQYCDFNNSNKVDMNDFILFARNFNTSCSKNSVVIYDNKYLTELSNTAELAEIPAVANPTVETISNAEPFPVVADAVDAEPASETPVPEAMELPCSPAAPSATPQITNAQLALLEQLPSEKSGTGFSQVAVQPSRQISFGYNLDNTFGQKLTPELQTVESLFDEETDWLNFEYVDL